MPSGAVVGDLSRRFMYCIDGWWGPALWEPFLASAGPGAVGTAVVEYAESSDPSSPGVEDAQGSQGQQEMTSPPWKLWGGCCICRVGISGWRWQYMRRVVGSAAVDHDIAVIEHADCSEPCSDIEPEGSRGQPGPGRRWRARRRYPGVAVAFVIYGFLDDARLPSYRNLYIKDVNSAGVEPLLRWVQKSNFIYMERFQTKHIYLCVLIFTLYCTQFIYSQYLFMTMRHLDLMNSMHETNRGLVVLRPIATCVMW